MGTRGRCADGADVRERDDTRGDGGKRREKGFTVNDVPKLRLADMRKERMRAGWPNPPLRLLLLLRQKTPYVGGSSRNTLPIIYMFMASAISLPRQTLSEGRRGVRSGANENETDAKKSTPRDGGDVAFGCEKPIRNSLVG